MTRHLPVSILLAAFALLAAAAPLHAGQRYDDSDRRYLDNLRREVRDLERQARELQGVVDERLRQIKEEAPKQVNPVKAELKAAESREDKAKDLIIEKRKALDAAQEKLDAVFRELKPELDSDPGYRAAELRFEEAKKSVDETEQRLRKSLATNEEYQLKKKTLQRLEIRMQVLREQQEAGVISADPIRFAAQQLLQAQSDVREFEESHFNDNKDYTAAKQELADATEALRTARVRVQDKLRDNPAYAEAEKAIDAARAEFAEGQAEKTEATKERLAIDSTLNRMERQFKKYVRETDALINRKNVLENQIRVKERRMRDYERNLRNRRR